MENSLYTSGPAWKRTLSFGVFNVLYRCFPFKQTLCSVKQKTVKSSLNVKPSEHKATQMFLNAVLKWTLICVVNGQNFSGMLGCWNDATSTCVFNYAFALNVRKLFWHVSIPRLSFPLWCSPPDPRRRRSIKFSRRWRWSINPPRASDWGERLIRSTHRLCVELFLKRKCLDMSYELYVVLVLRY